MAIYLGRSTLNAKNVALVPDQVTVHVSPQYHVYFDPGSHTVKKDGFDSLCAVKTGLRIRTGQIGKKKLLGNSKLRSKSS